MKHTDLQSPRCFLKVVAPEHITHIHQGLSNTLVTQYYDVHFATIQDTQEQMDWYENLFQNNLGCWWSAFLRDSNAFCGAIGFNNWDQTHRKAEIGCWLLPEFWGNGLMPEIFDAVVRYGFEQMALHRIEGFVDAENQKCKKALQKLNFQREGTMRECEFKNGAFLDIDIYAMLKPKQK